MWLAALACLSLAAKLEEVAVPSTITALQVPDCYHACTLWPFITASGLLGNSVVQHLLVCYTAPVMLICSVCNLSLLCTVFTALANYTVTVHMFYPQVPSTCV